ncbi:MAG: Chorismate synthase [Chlamydiales bacterium]|nr:Chorismate synthase [Chlamydiales bacterium]MCH9635262.1 Chorismate synthase [Chlamydiales bacterium]
MVIDGCPAGLPLCDDDINQQLKLRRPGRAHTSPRKERDEAEILSGLFEGKTTGAPISIIIWNQDVDSSAYESGKNKLRPGHAQYSYLKKYGIYDYRGGGRASARETACRVAAGAIAKKLLSLQEIEVLAYFKEMGNIKANPSSITREKIEASPLFCPDPIAEKEMIELLNSLEGDSIGGVVEMIAKAPAGLGDPIYEKLEANLAKAMLTIPASKGVEFGSGFGCTNQRGSEHNDLFIEEGGKIQMQSNRAGGILGGISTGEPIILRVAFKPTSTIQMKQKSVDLQGNPTPFEPPGKRHDPCVAIRAVPVVEAMGCLTLNDYFVAQCASLQE